jgi:hypothetical protein
MDSALCRFVTYSFTRLLCADRSLACFSQDTGICCDSNTVSDSTVCRTAVEDQATSPSPQPIDSEVGRSDSDSLAYLCHPLSKDAKIRPRSPVAF